MIPGPVEITEQVQEAMSTAATSHVSPAFIQVFGETLEMLRPFFLTTTAQPFVVSGSGTLGWDMIACNVLSPGQKALVIHTGYFGDSFGDCMSCYGINVVFLKSPTVGDRPSLEDLERVLTEQGPFNLITLTQVDTSTGVLLDVKAIAECVQRISPQTFIAVDAVCSAGAEELRMDAWGVDLIMTASQKALGAPPGLSIVMASVRVMKSFEQRTSPILNYYASWRRWLPIMKAYEARSPSYFATPAVQLIYALHASLRQLLDRGMDAIFEQHVKVSAHIKDTLKGWGLSLVTKRPEVAAHAMTAVFLPEGVSAAQLLKPIAAERVVLAGGLHKEIKDRYFRIGHMGLTVWKEDYVDFTLAAIRRGLDQISQ